MIITRYGEVARSGYETVYLSWLCEADGHTGSWSLEGRVRPREMVLGAIGDKRVEIPALALIRAKVC